jgi:hypothetical protein
MRPIAEQDKAVAGEENNPGSMTMAQNGSCSKTGDMLLITGVVIVGGVVLFFLGLKMRKSSQSQSTILDNPGNKEGYLALDIDLRYYQVHVAYNIDF